LEIELVAKEEKRRDKKNKQESSSLMMMNFDNYTKYYIDINPNTARDQAR